MSEVQKIPKVCHRKQCDRDVVSAPDELITSRKGAALLSREAVIRWGGGNPGSCHEKASDDAGRAATPQHHTC